jgi:hypothetical protein
MSAMSRNLALCVLGYTTCTNNKMNLEYAGETRLSMYGSLTAQLANSKSQ